MRTIALIAAFSLLAACNDAGTKSDEAPTPAATIAKKKEDDPPNPKPTPACYPGCMEAYKIRYNACKKIAEQPATCEAELDTGRANCRIDCGIG